MCQDLSCTKTEKVISKCFSIKGTSMTAPVAQSVKNPPAMEEIQV